MDAPSPFRYCPGCAHPASAAAPAREFHCGRCGYRYFHNVASAVAAFITCDGALLVTQRAHAPAAGTLDLPGGFVEPRESLEQALARELHEELGLATLPGQPRYLFSLPNQYAFAGVTYATADAFYAIECAARCPAVPADDAAAVEWLRLASVEPAAFGLSSVRQALLRFKQGR